MNREDGFPIADLDVGLFHDQKIVALARRLHDERQTAATTALYIGLVLESWAAGDRVTLDEALPAWWMAELDGIREDLHGVGLIDDESRIPADAWSSWFVPAFDRREKRRQSGAEGGRRSWQSRRDKRRRSDASAMPNPSVRPSGRPSYRQTGPAGRTGALRALWARNLRQQRAGLDARRALRDHSPNVRPGGRGMTRPSAYRRGFTRSWRALVRDAIEVHVRIYGWMCPGWGVPAHHSVDLTGDHELALSLGGRTTPANVQILCRACNSRKSNRPPVRVQLTLDEVMT